MSIYKTFFAALLLLVLSACSTGVLTGVLPEARLAALHSSSLDGVSVSTSAETATVRFFAIPESGQFVRLSLPAGQSVSASSWAGAEDTIKLVVPTAGAADIGIVPLPGSEPGPVSLELEFGPAPRTPSIPPVGDYNVITDLSISDAGGGGVTLEWTQVNTGDYDFNSEVNLADLVPIALHFGETYDRQATGAADLTEYWVDGDGNGEVNVADVTPIGLNYSAQVSGYNIYREDQLIPGTQPGGPTVPTTEGIMRAGLPPVYSKTVTALISDTFRVAPVDAEGIEGADSSGNAGPVDLLASINIDGQLLLDILNGQNPGVFGPGKITTRVIDPIEINNSIELGDVTQTAAELAEVRNLPRDQALYLQFLYIPAVDLITGDPKGTASIHGTSALEDLIVVTSVPVRIPEGTEPVEVSATIDIGTANPAGGYFTYLNTVMTIPGDDPATPAVETSYTIATNKRLDNANGLVAADSDQNEDYEDEAQLADDDLDCASERRREHELDDDDDDYDERNEIEIEGIVSAFDEAAGMITLSGAVLEAGELEIPLPDPLTLYFDELTRFEERIKQEGDDEERDIDPSTITAGDKVEVDLYRLSDDTGLLPDKYWIEKIDRRIDETE